MINKTRESKSNDILIWIQHSDDLVSVSGSGTKPVWNNGNNIRECTFFWFCFVFINVSIIGRCRFNIFVTLDQSLGSYHHHHFQTSFIIIDVFGGLVFVSGQQYPMLIKNHYHHYPAHQHHQIIYVR